MTYVLWALIDADGVKKACIATKNLNVYKKDKMMDYSSLHPRTQPVLFLSPFETPTLGKWLTNTALLLSMLFFDTASVIAMTTAAIPVDELVLLPWTIHNYCVLIYVHFC